MDLHYKKVINWIFPNVIGVSGAFIGLFSKYLNIPWGEFIGFSLMFVEMLRQIYLYKLNVLYKFGFYILIGVILMLFLILYYNA